MWSGMTRNPELGETTWSKMFRTRMLNIGFSSSPFQHFDYIFDDFEKSLSYVCMAEKKVGGKMKKSPYLTFVQPNSRIPKPGFLLPVPSLPTTTMSRPVYGWWKNSNGLWIIHPLFLIFFHWPILQSFGLYNTIPFGLWYVVVRITKSNIFISQKKILVLFFRWKNKTNTYVCTVYLQIAPID